MKKTKKKTKTFSTDRAFMIDYAKTHKISSDIIAFMKTNMDEVKAGILIDAICRYGELTDNICSALLA